MSQPDPGRFILSLHGPDRTPVHEVVTPNRRCVSWGHLAAQLFGRRDLRYAPAHFYLEFANLANPNDRVATSPVDPDLGLDYYVDLGDTPDRDFLRVPIPPVADITLDPDYTGRLNSSLGNLVTFRGDSAGTVGVHGKPFSASALSLVYGVAIVASPGVDWTGDILFARGYYDADRQVPKVDNLQVSIRYESTFGTASS